MGTVYNGYIMGTVRVVCTNKAFFKRKYLEEVKPTHIFLLSCTDALYPTVGEENLFPRFPTHAEIILYLSPEN